jgi:hypothetical protein
LGKVPRVGTRALAARSMRGGSSISGLGALLALALAAAVDTATAAAGKRKCRAAGWPSVCSAAHAGGACISSRMVAVAAATVAVVARVSIICALAAGGVHGASRRRYRIGASECIRTVTQWSLSAAVASSSSPPPRGPWASAAGAAKEADSSRGRRGSIGLIRAESIGSVSSQRDAQPR